MCSFSHCHVKGCNQDYGLSTMFCHITSPWIWLCRGSPNLHKMLLFLFLLEVVKQ